LRIGALEKRMDIVNISLESKEEKVNKNYLTMPNENARLKNEYDSK